MTPKQVTIKFIGLFKICIVVKQGATELKTLPQLQTADSWHICGI